MLEQAVISRTVRRYAEADWERLRSELEEESDWDCTTAMNPDTASMYLTNHIIDAAEVCVPPQKKTQKWAMSNDIEH